MGGSTADEARRRLAVLLALRDARRWLRGLASVDDVAAVARHEALGLLLIAGGLRSGWVWWAALRLVWAAGRMYERWREAPRE